MVINAKKQEDNFKIIYLNFMYVFFSSKYRYFI